MNDDEWQVWVSERPEAVRAAARRWPGCSGGKLVCYRSTENPRFHYTIYSYAETPTGVTCSLVHGRDSTLPGITTFGQPLEQLIRCDCGKWDPPTVEQKRATHKRLERLKQGRN